METSGDALTLEALRQGLRLRGDLAACFLKAIAKTAGSEGHSVVDLWVLFCLYANQDTRKKVSVVAVVVLTVVVDVGGDRGRGSGSGGSGALLTFVCRWSHFLFFPSRSSSCC